MTSKCGKNKKVAHEAIAKIFQRINSKTVPLHTLTNTKIARKDDHRSKFSNLSNWKEEAGKNQGFNGIRTRDLRNTGAMLYQLSYEATHWERGQLIEFISSLEE